jgi:hypothetical protein
MKDTCISFSAETLNNERVASSLYFTPRLPLSSSFPYEKSSETCIAERNL